MSVSSYRIMHMENIFPACFLSSRQLFTTHSAVDVSSAGKLWHFAVVRELLLSDLGVRLYQHRRIWTGVLVHPIHFRHFYPYFPSLVLFHHISSPHCSELTK